MHGVIAGPRHIARFVARPDGALDEAAVPRMADRPPTHAKAICLIDKHAAIPVPGQQPRIIAIPGQAQHHPAMRQ